MTNEVRKEKGTRNRAVNPKTIRGTSLPISNKITPIFSFDS